MFSDINQAVSPPSTCFPSNFGKLHPPRPFSTISERGHQIEISAAANCLCVGKAKPVKNHTTPFANHPPTFFSCPKSKRRPRGNILFFFYFVANLS